MKRRRSLSTMAGATATISAGALPASATVEVKPPPLHQVSAPTLSALLPPGRGNPIEWAPRNVFFPAASSATPRPYDFYQFPYHRGVWQAIRDPRIHYVTLRWATQLGKTALMTALVAYFADQDPCPMIWGGPDIPLVERVFERKLYPVMESSPAVARWLPPPHRRQKTTIDFGRCVLYSAGSGSISALGDISARVIFRNEIDKWSTRASTEGDAAELIEERRKAFLRWKIISESTPSESGLSRIDRLIASSDDRTFWIPCPTCGTYQHLEFERLAMPHDGQGALAGPDRCLHETHYPCCSCGNAIPDHLKLPAMRKGRWVRRGEAVDRNGEVYVDNPEILAEGNHAGFSLSSLYSPTITFGEFAAKWSDAQGNVGKIRNVVNGWLARSFAPKTRLTSEDQVLRHRGIAEGHEYARDTCPSMPLLCFLLVDVQEDCLWYSSWAWTANRSRYLLRYGQLPRQLEAALGLAQLTFTTTAGDRFRHTSAYMDSGYGERTVEVYNFCERNGWNPTKGFDSGNTAQPIAFTRLTERMNLLRINVIHFKDELLQTIHGSHVDQAGAWRLFNTCGYDFARQITAEKRIVRPDKYGRPRIHWENPAGLPNHYWDLAVMNEAAALAAEWEGSVQFFPEAPQATVGRGKPEGLPTRG